MHLYTENGHKERKVKSIRLNIFAKQKSQMNMVTT